MDDRIKKILEFLEPFGIGSFQDVSPVLNTFFPVNNIHDGGEVGTQYKLAQDFFTGLLGAGYIKGRDTEIRGLGVGNTSGGRLWFPKMRVEMAINSNGLEALSLERAKLTDSEMGKSVLATNASIQRLNGIMEKQLPIQTKAIKRTAIYAGLAAIIALAALLKDCKLLPGKLFQSEKTKQGTLLQKTLPELDSQQKIPLNLQSSPSGLKNDSTQAKGDSEN